MWSIFKHKEKNSHVMLILYILSFLIYSLSLTSLSDSNDDAFVFYMFIMMHFMVEAFKYSLINMSYYFANGSEYSVTKPILSSLKTHLRFLSIKTNDFVLYNVVYTILRLLPFILITLIMNKSVYSIYFILVFSAVYILKAYVGPMITYIGSLQVDVYLNEKELSRAEKNELVQDKIRELYPSINLKVFKLLKTIYSFSYISVTLGVYAIIFPFVLEIFNWNMSIVYGVIILAYINILIYGFYLNNLERKQDNVLYQE